MEELDYIEDVLGRAYPDVSIGRSRLFTGEEGSLEPREEFGGAGRWGERLNGQLDDSQVLGVQIDLSWDGAVPNNPLHYTKVVYLAEQGEEGLETSTIVHTRTGYAGSGRYLDREDEYRAEREVTELLEQHGINVSDNLEDNYGRFWRG